MQKGSMRQRRLCRLRMRRRFEWEEAARFLPGDLGKNWDNFGLGLMGGGRGGTEMAISWCTCANMGSAVEMGKLFLYTI